MNEQQPERPGRIVTLPTLVSLEELERFIDELSFMYGHLTNELAKLHTHLCAATATINDFKVRVYADKYNQQATEQKQAAAARFR